MNNIDIYVKRMAKSIYDKLFFVDKIFDDDISSFIDFGCADGTLISFAQQYYDCNFIGYDNNISMINKAINNQVNAQFYTDWQLLADTMNNDFADCILNLSSVIHEVYSYANNEQDIYDFWNIVFCSNFKYIVIRDMGNKNNNPLNKTYLELLEKIRLTHTKQLTDFECIYGKIDCISKLIHFLLKYKYIENWDREVKENYLPITLADIIKLNENYGNKYEIIYSKEYCLPYIKHLVEFDFNTELKDNTHYKVIFKRKN